MNRYIIGSLWDRANRNGANKNFEYLFEGRRKIDELNYRADNILDEAERTNQENINTNKRLDKIIAESGTSSTEVVDARGEFDVLNERLGSSDAQLNELQEETTKIYSKNNTNRIPVSSLNSEKRKKPLISFVDDDGNTAVKTKLQPIAEEHNVPFNLALIGAQLERNNNAVITTDEALDFQNNLGWEILSHGHNHVGYQEPGITEETIEYEARTSVEYMRSTGLNVKNFVYPGGQYDDQSIRITSRYYNSGLSTAPLINTQPLVDYKLGRIAFPQSAPNNTLAYYKSKVDEAVANNGWLIWMTHCGQSNFDANQTQILNDLVAYIKSINVDIVTIQQGLDEVGNVLSVNDNELYIAADGSNNVVNHIYSMADDITGLETVTIDTKPNELESGKTYISSIYTANNISKTPSGTRGILTIYRPLTRFHSYRRYVDVDRKEFISYSNSAGDGWTPFIKTMTTSGEQSYVLSSATITGNGYHSFNIFPSPIVYNNRQYAIVKPKNDLPQGLIFSSHHTGTGGSINVRLYNTTSSSITLTNFEWLYIITTS